MPVVEDDLALVGIVSRQDVINAMQLVQQQPIKIQFQIKFPVMPVEENGKNNPFSFAQLRPKWLTV